MIDKYRHKFIHFNMFLRKIGFLTLLFIILVQSGYSQNPALSRIDTNDLKRHLTFIASDSLQGRKFGTKVDGLEITASYLAGESGKMGLKPACENYFQLVNIVKTTPGEDNVVQLKNRNSKSEYETIIFSSFFISLGKYLREEFFQT